MTFKIRKLCSSLEEYEVHSDRPIDIGQMEERLSGRSGVELARHGTILTILFEDEGVVARLFSNGKAFIQAGFRKDAETICLILTEASSDVLGPGLEVGGERSLHACDNFK